METDDGQKMKLQPHRLPGGLFLCVPRLAASGKGNEYTFKDFPMRPINYCFLRTTAPATT
jgi:hypothetical protein